MRAQIVHLRVLEQVELSDATFETMWDALDADGSGTIEFDELNKVLRQGNAVTLAKDLQAGSMGAIETRASSKHALRQRDDLKNGASHMNTHSFATALGKARSKEEVLEKLASTVRRSGMRMFDL